MDVEGFLLTSGFALLLVLAGWSNQITTRSKEIRDIEKGFLDKANLKDKQYKKITMEKGTVEGSIIALVDFLYTKRDEDDLRIFDKTTRIKKNMPLINKKYSNRFWILLVTSFTLILSGIITFFLPLQYKFLTLFPPLVFIFIISYNLISTYLLEKEYSEDISEVMEKI